MEIREARITDYKEIADLTEQLGYPNEAEKLKDLLRILLCHREYHILVGTIDDKVVGWMQLQRTMSIETGSYVEITGLVVDHVVQRKGLGKLLIQEAAQWAKNIGYFRLRVRCSILRTESHKFYEQMGFKLKKEQKVFDSML
ncbi:GNAT family N-acetyltransferase [Sphingobacterium sp. ML3W]|uniref:GNAT family N-acetyltransferase n=1 Tax=Sphingobacterium sp. ML3W TaxID=1538644 RepID=UPI00249BFB82|nr:GNAT family N-acetyltransferase [Sphingobacterium sp. ML3W]WFA81642.1 GNAT family N-acetyltransferase [Sphingobacterium sp. ML3W]